MAATQHTSVDSVFQDPPSLLARIQRFWKDHERGYRDWWSSISVDERQRILQLSTRNMPLSRDDDGGSYGVAALLPEINLADLSQPNGLPDLFQYRANPDKSFVDWMYEDIEFVKPLWNRGKLVEKREQKKGFTVIHTGETYSFTGKNMDLDVQKHYKSMLDTGMVVPQVLYDNAKQRCSITFITLACQIDEFSDAALGLSGGITAMSSGTYCKVCKKTATDIGAASLSVCAKCKIVAYCSVECQKSDWKEHKKHCGKE